MWKEKFIKEGRITDGLIMAITGITSMAAVMNTRIFAAGLGALMFFGVSMSPRLAIFWLTVFAEDIFHLVNPAFGLKERLHPDLMLIIFFFMIVKLMLDRLYNKNELSDDPPGMFRIEVILMAALLIVEAANSLLLYGQPYILGLRASRYLFLYLLYFPLKELFKNPEYRKWTLDFLLYFGVFATTLYLVQYVVFDSFRFMYMDTTIERFGQTRLKIEVGLILSSSFIAVSRAITCKNQSKYWLIAIYELAAFALLTKTRMVMFGLAVAFAAVLFLQKRHSRAFFAYAIVLFIGINAFNMEDSLLYKMYELTVSEVSAGSGNYDIRVSETKFYMDQATKTPLLGRGVINKLHPEALRALGETYRFSLSDIGIMGFFFSFGLVGVAWAALMFFKLSRLSAMALKTTDESRYSILLMTVFLISTCATIMFMDNENMVLYIMVFASIYENVVNENSRSLKAIDGKAEVSA